jgi:hypothetical protein
LSCWEKLECLEDTKFNHAGKVLGERPDKIQPPFSSQSWFTGRRLREWPATPSQKTQTLLQKHLQTCSGTTVDERKPTLFQQCLLQWPTSNAVKSWYTEYSLISSSKMGVRAQLWRMRSGAVFWHIFLKH